MSILYLTLLITFCEGINYRLRDRNPENFEKFLRKKPERFEQSRKKRISRLENLKNLKNLKNRSKRMNGNVNIQVQATYGSKWDMSNVISLFFLYFWGEKYNENQLKVFILVV